MKNILSLIAMAALISAPAYAQKDENKRISNSGTLITEILNIPDDIPADIIGKAIELPSWSLSTSGS